MTDGDESQSLSIREASLATGATRPTLRRDIDAGRFPGAFREDTSRGSGLGIWRVPVADLLAAGYSLRSDSPAAPESDRTGLENEVRELRAELARERERREAAEALAFERATALEDAQRALRAMLASAPLVPVQSAEVARPRRPRGNWLR